MLKLFLSTKQRLVDSDQQYLKKANKGKYDKVEKASAKSAKWKEQSNAFREAMKAAREGKAAPPTADSSLIPCSFCGRKFNDKAAAKHIPFCESKFKENQMKQPAKGRKKVF